MRVPKLQSRWAFALVLLIATLVLSACGSSTQSMFAPTGSNSQEIYNLFFPVFWMAIGVFVVVEGVLIYSISRYRRRTSDGIPLQIHGNTPVEIAWTIIPALIVLFISVLTFRTQALIERPAENDRVKIEVIGHKWWWEFRYPEHGNLITANELHMPADRDVELLITSDDVIHSFWVPRLAGKRDALPNHVNRLLTQPTGDQSMIIRGQCAEFCGKTHAMMGFYVVVQPQAEFDQWVQQQTADAPVPAGIQQNSQGQSEFNQVAQAGFSDQVAQTQATPEVTERALEDEPVLEQTAQAALENAPELQATAQAGSQLIDPSDLSAQGYELFRDKGCISCHAIKGYPGAESRVGPDLTHIGSRNYIVAGWLENNTENMQAWLRHPDAVKPENAMAAVVQRGTLTEEQIDALTAYLQSLK